jgi:hypothetical protein
VALIVAALAAYWTAQALTDALRAPFKAAGISGAALSATAALVASWPHEAMEGTGPAQRWAIRANLTRRASFFLHAARRTQQAIVAARSKDQPVMAAIRDALATERRFMALHVQASTGRVQAASAVDGAAATYGNLLGWQAILDDRTSKECRVANGGTFTATKPPIIGFPGAVHPACRCRPVKAHSGAPSVNEKLAAAGLAGGN